MSSWWDFSPATQAWHVVNVGRATIDGVELEISARPIDALSLTANFGFNNPVYSTKR